ncbi:hypothetical protein B0H34DRAFT_834054 [Crassisporium funariophilum]|nr:hypothetical protein B0H34DRAFT_834054 [Crassisporium funariophilum]
MSATMASPSPRNRGVGLLQNFMSLDSPNSVARSSRIALKDELAGKLVFDDARAFATDQDLLNARRELDKITAAAIGNPIEEMEADDEIHESFGIRTVNKREEKKMYKPLSSIFQHVEKFLDASGTFESTDSMALKSDSSTWGFPKGSPDFGIFECLSLTTIASGRKPVLWRQTEGLCQFCVAIFDRAGVMFSPIHDMWEDIEIFIRVIRSLTCHLSSVELGQDPTVTTLPDLQHETWRNQTKDLGREAPKDFLTFAITTGGPGGPSWYTIGLPIWTSVSLLGLGHICLVGEEVLFPGEQRYITTSTLRGPAMEEKIEGDVFLHRLLLKSRGRPLWEYRSEKKLLQEYARHSAGILYRDISADNIMLSVDITPDVGAEGFLMDLEFARLKRSSLDTKTTIAVPPLRMPGGGMTSPTIRSHTICGPDVMCGAAMTGTAQFMAAEILQAIVTENPIEHEPRHDIEFIYVLAYSVTR